MNARWLAVGLLITTGTLVPTLSGTSRPGIEAIGLEGRAAHGRRIFVQKTCVDCHAVMGSGGDLGPDLAEVGRGRSFHRLLAKLWDHIPLMSSYLASEGLEWPTLTREEMQDLVAYLFQLNFFEEPGDYEAGKDAFHEKGCFGCHRIGGNGGDVGPPLDPFASHASPLRMVSAMWSHGPAMVKLQRSMDVKIPTFAGSEVADVLAYLRGTSLESAGRSEFLSPGDPTLGLAVFKKKQCQLCHPVEGSEEEDVDGPDLSLPRPKRSVSEYAGILWNHGPMVWDKMLTRGIAIPPFTAKEIADLVAYLFVLDFYRGGGDARRGEQSFRERGCVACHALEPDAEGVERPDSALLEATRPDAFAAALWNHGPVLMERADTSVPSIDQEEMRDLLQYLSELSGGER